MQSFKWFRFIASKKEKIKNCGFASKNNLHFSYKNYLREKRSKILETNLSRPLSSNAKAENQKINEKNKYYYIYIIFI